MPDGVFASVQGLDELRARISGLTEDAQATVWNAATRKAALVLARQAAENARKLDDPVSGEMIARNIVDGRKYPGVRKKGKRFLAKGDVGYRVGVLGGAGGRLKKGDPHFDQFPGGDTRHWRFWEFGSENTEAKPILREVGNQAGGEALQEFFIEAEKALTRAVKKQAKRVAARSRLQTARRRFFGID